MPTKSNRCFGFVISGMGGRGGSVDGWGLFSMQSKCIWLDAEQRYIVSNNSIGCNFKPFASHAFMTSIKNDRFCDPLRPQRLTIDLLFKNKKICYMASFKRPPTLFSCGRHKYMVPYVFAAVSFFSVLEKITIKHANLQNID